MTINFPNKQIVITKTEAAKASKIKSKEYEALNELMKQYPAFNVVLRTAPIKRHKSSNDLKGLNYAFMERYIKNHGTDSQMEALKELRFNTSQNRIKAASYGEIKKWFLECFPEIKAASAKEVI